MPWSIGAAAIAAERRRQYEEEGHSFAHDDTHTNGQLLAAARCYAWAAGWLEHHPGDVAYISAVPVGWPWESWEWKPSPDPKRNLVRAGALIGYGMSNEVAVRAGMKPALPPMCSFNADIGREPEPVPVTMLPTRR